LQQDFHSFTAKAFLTKTTKPQTNKNIQNAMSECQIDLWKNA
jgi:hypothetical protein